MGVCHCLAWGSVCVPSTLANSVHLGKKRGRRRSTHPQKLNGRQCYVSGLVRVPGRVDRCLRGYFPWNKCRAGCAVVQRRFVVAPWTGTVGNKTSGIKPGLLWIVGIPITGGQLVRGPPEESDVCSRAPNRQITALPAGWRASCFVRAAPGSSRAATSRPQVSRRGGWREEKLRGWA